MTNEKQLENQEKVKMPWQGKVWILLIITSSIASACIFIYRFYTGEIDSILYFFGWSFFVTITVIAATLSSFSLPYSIFYVTYPSKEILFFVLILFFIVNYFLSKGFLYGSKRLVFLAFSISCLKIIFLIIFFIELMLTYGFDMSSLFEFFIPMIFVVMPALYLEIFCLKHPYYNQKKKLENNSVKI